MTVDDLPVHGPLAPGTDRVTIGRRLTEAFHRHHMPPVYGFVNGKKVDDEPATEQMLREWIASGNLLGNHTYSHPSLTASATPDYLADITKGEAILAKVSPGGPWHFFRYPFLFEGDTPDKRAAVRAFLAEKGYTIAEVSIDGDDWAFNPPFARCAEKGSAADLAQLRADLVAAHVDELRRMRDLSREFMGRDVPQVLLFHAGVAEADAIEELLTAYEREGVVWVTLPQALADPFYAIDPNIAAKFGAALPYLVARMRGRKEPPPPMFARGLEQRLEKLCR